MFIYVLPNGKEVCRSSAKVEFSDNFPQLKAIKPKTEKKPASGSKNKDKESDK